MVIEPATLLLPGQTVGLLCCSEAVRIPFAMFPVMWDMEDIAVNIEGLATVCFLQSALYIADMAKNKGMASL